MSEKVKSNRVRLSLPVEVELNSKDSASKQVVATEMINISEEGLTLRSDIPLGAIDDICIMLPPCYSENPKDAAGIRVRTKTVSSSFVTKNKSLYELEFVDMNNNDKVLLRQIINYEIEKSKENVIPEKPKLKIKREAHSCNMYAVDLTIGCENGCRYCHYSKAYESAWQKKHPTCKDFPIPVDISPLYRMEKLPESVVYLSPLSDPFAPKARELTHELLSYMLPRGVVFTIATKNIIPDMTIDLLKKYHHLIEAIGIGLTNLSDERNDILEPNSPKAGERLEQIYRLKETGCPIGVRIDPMFPLIDDTDENFNNIINELGKAGVIQIAGAYIFTYGRTLKKLREIPLLKDSLDIITERTYSLGGVALSAPLEYKKSVYEKMNNICKKNGILFSTCGCKQVGLKDVDYQLICRNIFYNKAL